jgi:hypothetical protein
MVTCLMLYSIFPHHDHPRRLRMRFTAFLSPRLFYFYSILLERTETGRHTTTHTTGQESRSQIAAKVSLCLVHELCLVFHDMFHDVRRARAPSTVPPCTPPFASVQRYTRTRTHTPHRLPRAARTRHVDRTRAPTPTHVCQLLCVPVLPQSIPQSLSSVPIRGGVCMHVPQLYLNSPHLWSESGA